MVAKKKGSAELARLARQYFGNKCAITLTPFKETGFTIHHLNYVDGDIERKNYPDGMDGTNQYYLDLEDQVIERRQDFILVKHSIHNKMDHFKNGLSRLKRDDKIRFCAYALLTEKRNRKSHVV